MTDGSRPDGDSRRKLEHGRRILNQISADTAEQLRYRRYLGDLPDEAELQAEILARIDALTEQDRHAVALALGTRMATEVCEEAVAEGTARRVLTDEGAVAYQRVDEDDEP